MFSWLKKHFIPHPGNDHCPHILRDESIRAILMIIIFLEIFSFLLPTLTRVNITGNMAAVLPAVLASLTNGERQTYNLKTLTINPLLNKAAEMKAQDMATNGYFAHTSPEGKTPWYWLGRVGYKYQYAGENLAINFSDSKDVTSAWMESPTHRANIVKKNYTEIGTGIASGMYEGHETMFVAQVYANPLPLSPKQAGPKKIEIKTTEEPLVVAIEKEEVNILGVESVTNTENIKNELVFSPEPNPAFWQKLLASPRNSTNIIFYTIFCIIFTALILYIIIRAKNHHLGLIINGLFILAIIGGVLVANYYWSYRDMMIVQSLDYMNQNQ